MAVNIREVFLKKSLVLFFALLLSLVGFSGSAFAANELYYKNAEGEIVGTTLASTATSVNNASFTAGTAYAILNDLTWTYNGTALDKNVDVVLGPGVTLTLENINLTTGGYLNFYTGSTTQAGAGSVKPATVKLGGTSLPYRGDAAGAGAANLGLIFYSTVMENIGTLNLGPATGQTTALSNVTLYQGGTNTAQGVINLNSLGNRHNPDFTIMDGQTFINNGTFNWLQGGIGYGMWQNDGKLTSTGEGTGTFENNGLLDIPNLDQSDGNVTLEEGTLENNKGGIINLSTPKDSGTITVQYKNSIRNAGTLNITGPAVGSGGGIVLANGGPGSSYGFVNLPGGVIDLGAPLTVARGGYNINEGTTYLTKWDTTIEPGGNFINSGEYYVGYTPSYTGNPELATPNPSSYTFFVNEGNVDNSGEFIMAKSNDNGGSANLTLRLMNGSTWTNQATSTFIINPNAFTYMQGASLINQPDTYGSIILYNQSSGTWPAMSDGWTKGVNVANYSDDRGDFYVYNSLSSSNSSIALPNLTNWDFSGWVLNDNLNYRLYSGTTPTSGPFFALNVLNGNDADVVPVQYVYLTQNEINFYNTGEFQTQPIDFSTAPNGLSAENFKFQLLGPNGNEVAVFTSTGEPATGNNLIFTAIPGQYGVSDLGELQIIVPNNGAGPGAYMTYNGDGRSDGWTLYAHCYGS